MDLQNLKKEIQQIRQNIETLENATSVMKSFLHKVEEQIMEREDQEVNLWFDKIRQTVIRKTT